VVAWLVSCGTITQINSDSREALAKALRFQALERSDRRGTTCGVCLAN